MERSRETRKVSMSAQARRRQRGSGFRDSTDEDGPLELQESARPRDRKKERERERERHRELASRNKRRRGDRLMHAGNREDGPEDSTDESVNDDEEEDNDDEGGGGGRLRMRTPNPASTLSPTVSIRHQNHQPKSSIPSTKMFRPASPWKPADELIGAPVPRKPRSASTKRAHECLVSRPGGMSSGDQLHRQASMSPARSSLASAAASPLRISPSSSTIFARKKLKPIVSNKLRNPPEASTSKAPSSSKEDEIEFEIAEVLYGLGRQPTSSSKPEAGANEPPNSDSKSRVSSPVPTSSPLPTSILLPHNGSSASVATGPKGKRPRQANYGSDENFGFRSQSNLISKSDVEQAANSETVPVLLEKNLKSDLTNDIASADLEQSIIEQKVEPTKLLRNNRSESNNLRRELIAARMKDDYASSTKRDSSENRFDENQEDNHRLRTSELGINGHEKFQIDLMAPPPPIRTLPDRDTKIEYVPAERNKSVPDSEKLKPLVKDSGKTEITSNKARTLVEIDQKRFKGDLVEQSDVQKASLCKERFVELQLNNTENNGGESDLSTAVANRQLILEQQQQGHPHLSGVPTRPQAAGDKTVHIAGSLAPAMSIAGWQGGLTPMGYMAPLQGAVSMDGSAVSSAPIQPQLVLNQPRPKRCATHCYIARNISYHQQFTRMNPFWPAAAGSAPTLYGTNPCNLNVFPPAEIHGSVAVRAMNPVQYRSLSVFHGSNNSKDKPSQGPNVVDSHGKQILLQQSLPVGAPTNLLQGPAFIIPLIQQQAAVAASALTTNMKNPSAAGVTVPTGNPNSVTSTPSSAPATMSFNYPLTANETQYLAILQNNPYQYAFPTQAGTPQVLRGAHPQAMPLFNGSFFSPPMVYPSQLQQQPQKSAHGHQIPTGQNTGISNGTSSSQKNLQNHSQKFQGNGNDAGTVQQKQNVASPKNQPSQMLMQQQNPHLTEASSEESPSTADSQGSCYNLPIHVQISARTSASSALVGGSTSTVNGNTNGNHSDKKLQQHQKGLKNGGGPPTLGMSSMGQNHAILQTIPDAGRHSYQVTAVAAQKAHQNRNFQIVDEVRKRSGIDGQKVGKERKSAVTQGVLSNHGLSIAFSRSDLDSSVVQANNNSSTNLKVVSGPGRSRSSGPLLPTPMNTASSLNSQQQHLQKQELIQLHKQTQQYTASSARGNTTSMSNGNVYPDHLPTNAAMSAKLRDSMSAFEQNISGGSSSPTQCPQWKNSALMSLSQVPAPVFVSSNSTSIKNNYQQQSQSSQQSHMQISFGGGNLKTSTAVQGQPHSTGHQGPSQIMVGSPAATSNYKNGGSPKTTNATMVAYKVKDSSMPSRSSSPTSAKSVSSSHGNSNIGMSQSNSGSKSQILQQQQRTEPQLLKLSMQQTQTILPSYMQTGQGPNSSSVPSFLPAANSGNHQRQRSESQLLQQSQSPCGSSSVMSVTSAVTSDPGKAFAVAATAGNNVKAPSHRTSNLSVVQHSGQQQHLPSSFGYMHGAPAGVQAKPAQQKQQIE